MKPRESESNADSFAMFANVLALVGQIADAGVPLEPDIVAAIGAASMDSSDSYAREMLDARVEPYLLLSKAFPQPWGQPPSRGEVAGPYLVGHVDGQPDNLFGLTDEELLLNVLVFGEQGFGKTTFIKALLISLMEKADG